MRRLRQAQPAVHERADDDRTRLLPLHVARGRRGAGDLPARLRRLRHE